MDEKRIDILLITIKLSWYYYSIKNISKYNKDSIEINNSKNRLYEKFQNSKEKLKKLLIKYETEYNVKFNNENKILKIREYISIAKELDQKYDIEIIENKIEESIEIKKEYEDNIIYI